MDTYTPLVYSLLTHAALLRCRNQWAVFLGRGLAGLPPSKATQPVLAGQGYDSKAQLSQLLHWGLACGKAQKLLIPMSYPPDSPPCPQ